MELNQLATNEGVLVLNEIAVDMYLSQGLKTKRSILNIIEHPWIEVCGFRSDVEHSYLLGLGLSYYASLEDTRPIRYLKRQKLSVCRVEPGGVFRTA